MHIKYIELENIRSHKYTEFSLDDQGLCFIKGKNGSGKSTIVKGLIFCLFGIGADDVVNESVGKNARVTIIGANGDDTFKVERYRKHDEHKNNLYFFINGEPVPAATNTATQKKLEDYIGCDYRSFLNIASFSSEMLMFASATDAERKAIFEKILQDLDVYKEYHEDSKEQLDKYKDEQSQVAHTLDLEERELEVTKKFLEQEKAKADAENEKTKSRLVILDKKIRTLDKVIEEHEQLQSKYARYMHATNTMYHWLEGREDKSNDWASCRGEIERTLSDLDMLEQDFCAFCNQKIGAKHKQKEKARLNKQLGMLHNKDDTLTKYCDTYDKVEGHIEKLQRKTSRWQGKLSNINEIREQRRELVEEQTELKTDAASDTTTRKLSSKVKKISKKVARLKTILKTVDKDIIYQEEIVKSFSKTGIPNVIIARALLLLEERTNSYLDILTNGLLGITFSGFSLTKKGGVRNKIGINVVSASGVSAFDSYSGGEKQRLNIAILLALRDVAEMNKGIKINCLFMDEVLDLSLDEGGIEEVLSLLKAKRESVDSIFVISPKDSVLYNTSVEFDNVYTVAKKRGFSEIN